MQREVPLLLWCGAPGTGLRGGSIGFRRLRSARGGKGRARDCAAAVPGSVATTVALTVTPEEQQERILTRANTRYGVERGGGSSAQTPEALAQVVDSARQQLKDEAGNIPGALVLATVGVPVVELAHRLLVATGWPRSVSRT